MDAKNVFEPRNKINVIHACLACELNGNNLFLKQHSLD